VWTKGKRQSEIKSILIICCTAIKIIVQLSHLTY